MVEHNIFVRVRVRVSLTHSVTELKLYNY